jgi:hypothetical protein
MNLLLAMNFLMVGNGGWGAALLPMVTVLLFEEMTYGGLVRLLLAPWPKTRRSGEHDKKRNQPGAANRSEGDGK